MYILVKLISYIPLRLLYSLSDFLFFLIYRVIKYRRGVVASNLFKAFPEKSAEERKAIEYRFYINFCDFIVETIKGVTISKEQVMKRVSFTNLDELKKIIARNKSVLFVTSHQFNWELMQLSAALQFPIGIDYIYHPLHNKGSDKLMLKLRGRFGAEPVKRREVGRQVIRRRNEARGYALLADQLPGGKDKKVELEFLGINTLFFEGIEQLAHLVNGPVVYSHIIKVKRGYYEVKMVELIKDPKAEPKDATVKAYVQAIEDNIKEQPEGWLWSHNRWKKR